jgi:hypothetical protein
LTCTKAILNHREFKAAVAAELIRRNWEYENLVRPGLSLSTIRLLMADPKKTGRDPSMTAAGRVAAQLNIDIDKYTE